MRKTLYKSTKKREKKNIVRTTIAFSVVSVKSAVKNVRVKNQNRFSRFVAAFRVATLTQFGITWSHLLIRLAEVIFQKKKKTKKGVKTCTYVTISMARTCG